MPDAGGNFKGIVVPELPWQRDDREREAMQEQRNCPLGHGNLIQQPDGTRTCSRCGTVLRQR